MTSQEESKKNFGERVKKRRIELGLSQDELARMMNYGHRSSIQKLESGENSIPQDKIERLAECLNTTIQNLMGWEQFDVTSSDFANYMFTMIEEHLDSILPTEDDFKLIALYHKASERDRKIIDSVLSAYSGEEQ